MYDLISIGNISVDIFYQGASLTYTNNRFQFAIGGKYFADSIVESLGGGGANVAIGGSKHGLKTAVLGHIGNNPFKSMILEKLRSHSVSTSLCQYVDNYFNLSSIFLTKTGERSIVHYTSPHQHILSNKDDNHNLLNSQIVYMGNLQHVSLTEKCELLHFFKKHNKKVVVNFGANDCRRNNDQLKELLKPIDTLIINGHEFSDMVKVNYADIDFTHHIIKKYIPYLSDKNIIITLGAKGSYAYTMDTIFHQKAYSINKIVDTTGAGDGFTAGFISGFIKTKSLSEAMNVGATYAAKILTQIGAN
ncbi:hypothetical protein COY87_03155 [Candidatus Roizmanbacteria bacterium CG_4_10_14_0_8_um_filter_33_9]|uniref:Carbohydrate kinase PfkB domain-containing protein n=1 Tax=Candidatus Roizmanbacteria bacterium CG_4_10_14_0_8_um_filter_33_9 TaxID=1974826 RepID=A0A2M7QI93_9BACT|nr:MAG: hypothetical protein COY87_03155 [Candidatus Roizmanbacteria bacterium CG_4_10_14_0_8_um_filter_33_9]